MYITHTKAGNRVIASQIAWIIRLMVGPYTIVLLLYVCAIFGFLLIRNYFANPFMESIGSLFLIGTAFLLMYTENILRKTSTDVLVTTHKESQIITAFAGFVHSTSFVHQVGTFAGIIFIVTFSMCTHGGEYNNVISPILVVVLLHINMYIYMLVKGILIYKSIHTCTPSEYVK